MRGKNTKETEDLLSHCDPELRVQITISLQHNMRERTSTDMKYGVFQHDSLKVLHNHDLFYTVLIFEGDLLKQHQFLSV